MSSLFKALERAETEGRSRPVPQPPPPSDGRAPDPSRRPSDVLLPGVDLPEPCEEYEKLKVMITLAPNRADLRSVMFVSALPGEGVTTVTLGVANAAAVGAPAGVLLVDANFATPTLASRLGAAPRLGLSDILAKRATRADAVARTAVSRVFVLDGGAGPVNFTSARSLDDVRELLTDLQTTYDHVLVDGGSLETCPESVLLSRHVDGVAIVVHAEHTPSEVVVDATARLRRAGARLLGVVLNRRRTYVPASVAKRL
jgi:Mrp family chromosome partitioning ATPase